MKNLLFKEIRLCIPPQAWIFAFLSMLIAVPSWPAMTAFIYPLAGFMTLFPIALANRDILYTSILPVKKSDVVKGKVLLVSFLELLALVWSIPFAIIKVTLIVPTLPADQIYPELGVNFATYGFILFIFAIFNIIFIPWYYKKPNDRNTAAQLVSIIVAMFIMGLISGLFMGIPGLAEFINDFSNIPSLIAQFSILVVGLILFIVSGILCTLFGGKNFQKVNL